MFNPYLYVDIHNPVNLLHPLAQTLHGWWLPLPQIAGGKYWYDIINSNNLTLTNCNRNDTGWHGTNKFPYVTFSNSTSGTAYAKLFSFSKVLDITGWSQFTISVWARGFQANMANFLNIVNGWTTDAATTGFGLYLGSSATIRFYVGTGTFNLTPNIASPWDGKWHHIVGVYDGVKVYIYIDGALKGSATAGTPGPITITGGLNLGFSVTRPIQNLAASPFPGDVTDLMIYNGVLSASDIKGLYYEGLMGYPKLLNRNISFKTLQAIIAARFIKRYPAFAQTILRTELLDYK